MERDGETVATKLEEGPLREIARLTKGTYTPAHAEALSLGELYRELIEPRPVHESEDDALAGVQQHYSWFFGAAVALLGLELLLGAPGRSVTRPQPAS